MCVKTDALNARYNNGDKSVKNSHKKTKTEFKYYTKFKTYN